MKTIVITFFIFISGTCLAETKKWPGLHSFNRVFVPSDSDQKVNYLLPSKTIKKAKINAPLVTTEMFYDPDRKFKYLKLNEQAILSNQADEN